LSETEKNVISGGRMVKTVEFVDSHGYMEKSKAILETVGNLRLVGDTGCGKTTLLHRLAYEYDAELYEIVLTRDVTKWDLLACDILQKGETKTREGIILQWLLSKSKKKKIAYLDGFNYSDPSILSLLEPISDFRGTVWVPELGKTFKRTEDHFLVISYNPSEKSGYSGTFIENIATIRRFEGLIIDYLPPIAEKRLIKKYCPDNYDFVSKFVEIARKTRDLFKRGKLRTPLTTGNLINYAKLYHKKGLAESDIIEIASSLFPEDERALFKDLFEKSGEIDPETLKKTDETDQS